MVMSALRKGASGGILKYILLGTLVMAAAGLVFMDIGGFFRGGTTGSDVAKVGNQSISINEFDKITRITLNRLGMTPAQAYQIGYIKELLNNEIRTSLLQQKAADIGIRASTAQVAQNVQKLIQPMARPGQTPQEVLQQLLASQGLSERELTSAIAREMAVNLLGNAIQSGVLDSSETMIRDLARYENEKRTIRLISFKNEDFKDIEEPSDEKLLEFYEKTKEAYAIPEMRKSQIILIEADTLKDSLEISNEEIKDVYTRNISAYSHPETRKIEQVILADADQATEVYRQVQEGVSLKDAVQSATGNTTDYIPPREFAKDDIIEDLREPVFAAKENEAIGPLQSALGHHVAVVQNIIPPHTTPLEEVKGDIKEQLMETRLLDAQYELADSVDDYLAAGEDINTIKEELNITVRDMPFTNSFGLNENGEAAFTSLFGPEAQTLLTSLFELTAGEASPVMELADGRMAAVLVTDIKEKSFTPFEEVKESLKKRWIEDMRRAQNKTQVLEMLSASRNEKTAFEALAKAEDKKVDTISNLKRSDEPKAPLTVTSFKTVFEAPRDELFIIELKDGVAIAEVQEVQLPETLEKEDFKAVQNKLLQSQQNEAYRLYVTNLRGQYGVSVNEKLLDSVYGVQAEQ